MRSTSSAAFRLMATRLSAALSRDTDEHAEIAKIAVISAIIFLFIGAFPNAE
jgi:hypothetical protein